MGAASTGQQPQGDFWQTETGVWLANAIAASQCQFQPAAEREVSNGRNQRLLNLSQTYQQTGEVGRSKGRRTTKFFDIRTGRKQATGAMDDDCPYRRVSGSALAGLQNCRAHRLAEGVDRWTGQTDQRQPRIDMIINQGAHGDSL
ncbi:hypothetical protein D3C73_1029000 [compost metagenome]